MAAPTCKREFAEEECAECGHPIEIGDTSESTYCGTMHSVCLNRHMTHCGVCRADAMAYTMRREQEEK